MKSVVIALWALLILSACSSSPSPVLPPVLLKPLKNEFAVSRVWQQQLGDGASDNYLKFPPAFGDNVGYGVDYQGRLIAFKLKTGEVLWQRSYDYAFGSAPILASDRLIIGTKKGQLLALDRNSGDV